MGNKCGQWKSMICSAQGRCHTFRCSSFFMTFWRYLMWILNLQIFVWTTMPMDTCRWIDYLTHSVYTTTLWLTMPYCISTHTQPQERVTLRWIKEQDVFLLCERRQRLKVKIVIRSTHNKQRQARGNSLQANSLQNSLCYGQASHTPPKCTHMRLYC